ncbi:MAG: cell wall hydrolase [Firmicutes bacterium]|nr:cell wall hydrolase [Bacillota bacterium]
MLQFNQLVRTHWVKKTMALGTVFIMLATGVNPATADVLHRIKPGESLYQIAKNNGTTVKELKQANGLQGDLIYAGDKLALPEQPQTAAGNTNPAPSGQAASVAAQPPPQANSQGPAARQWISSRDVDLLARLIAAEASGEPFSGQVAVAAVILNRMKDPRFPATVAGNVFKRHEFESVSNGLIWRRSPDGEAYKAAEAAIKGWDPTYGCKFFFNPAKVHGYSWVWTRRIVERIGNHVFAV